MFGGGCAGGGGKRSVRRSRNDVCVCVCECVCVSVSVCGRRMDK